MSISKTTMGRTALLVLLAIAAAALVLRLTLNEGTAAAAPPVAAFAVLQSPAAAGVEANAPIQQAAQEDTSLNVPGARRVGQVGIGSLWLIPTSDGRTCLGIEPDPSAFAPVSTTVDGKTVSLGGPPTLTYNCVSNATAASQGLLTGLRGRIAGYTPDGAKAATATREDGTSVAVDASKQVFTVPARSVAISVGAAPPERFGFTTAG